MAYKIVVDAGHGGCEMRKGLLKDVILSESERSGNGWVQCFDVETSEVSVDAGKGRSGAFVVEREFSEGSAVEVLERIVGRLLEIWEGRRDSEEGTEKVWKGRMAE